MRRRSTVNEFQTEMVVHSVLEALLASEVTLSCLNGYMTE